MPIENDMRAHRMRESDPMFSMDEDQNENDLLIKPRKKKKDDKVPFSPEVSF